MADPKNSAKRICDLLLFRGILEILETIMIENYESNYLIQMFDFYVQFPEGLFNLKLNKKYEEQIRNIIKQKVEKFLDDYIKGKMNVIILDN